MRHADILVSTSVAAWAPLLLMTGKSDQVPPYIMLDAPPYQQVRLGSSRVLLN